MSGRPPSRGDGTAWSVVWAFAGTAASRLLWLGALAVLARLLAPRDFGLLAFALVYITYVETIADLGTGAALIYWPGRREEAAQVTFVSNALAGLAWCAVTLVAAPWIAGFFHSPEGVPILRALALSFPLKFLGTAHDALCQKEMRFRVRLVPEVAMAAGKALVAVGLALAGFGVWSLVWGQLVGLAAWTVALWLVVPWRPNWRWPSGLARPMLAYGRGIVAVNVLAAITHHADLVIVGRLLGARILGLYQMAYKVPEMTVIVSVWVVSKVLFPAFSRAHAAGEEVGALYVTALRWIGLLAVPASLGLALVAEPLVVTLFGAAWREAAPILQALALYTGLRALGAHAGDVLKATGRPGLLAAIGIVKAALMVPLLLLAARSGPVAVALTMAGVTAVTVLFNVAAVCRLARVSPFALLSALRPSLLAGAGMAVVLLAWRRLAPGDGPLALVSAVVLGAGAYLVILRVMNPGLLGEMRRALGPHPLAPSPISHPPNPGRGGTQAGDLSTTYMAPTVGNRPPSPGGGVGGRWERGPGGEVSIDRFVLPADDPAVASFLVERLLAPHNLRERLRRSALLAVPTLAARLPHRSAPGNGHGPALEMVEAALGEPDLLRGTPLEGRPVRWLLVEDYAGNGRGRLAVFLFAAGEASPSAVLKLRRAGASGSSLRREGEALRLLAERLPADLRMTVPRLLAEREVSGIEILVMEALPGVSAYMEMQGRLAPGRAVDRHFDVAADWLARFHRATGASHGDFWARNLLVGPDGAAAVVDWEHFAKEAPPYEDLFCFPLTYGLNYPWERWRRLSPEEAFRRTFLEENRVSRAVARYLARYAQLAGVEPAALRQLFDLYLETRPEGDLPWSDFRSLLGRAGRSVFSG